MTDLVAGITIGLCCGLAVGILVAGIRGRRRLRTAAERLETVAGSLQPVVTAEGAWRRRVEDELGTVARQMRDLAHEARKGRTR